MPLFQSTSPCGGGSGSTAAKTFQYDFGLRFQVQNTIFLRLSKGFGPFSNVVPEYLPCDALLEKLIVSADITEFDTFTVDVFRNGALVYSLIKPIGLPNAIQLGGMPSFLAGDALSVRISNVTPFINEPIVTTVFGEI